VGSEFLFYAGGISRTSTWAHGEKEVGLRIRGYLLNQNMGERLSSTRMGRVELLFFWGGSEGKHGGTVGRGVRGPLGQKCFGFSACIGVEGR